MCDKSLIFTQMLTLAVDEGTKPRAQPKRSGAYSGIYLGGAFFFTGVGGLSSQHPLGPENPLKSIDFPGQGGG